MIGRDPLTAEVDRLRAGLLACAEAAGEDVSDGIPSWPDVVEWAVRAVREGRRESEDAIEAAEGKLAEAIEALGFYGAGGRRKALARLRSSETKEASNG